MLNLSIILPVYNVAGYLRRCLLSILPLLELETELIVVNDGSTDNCSEIINIFHEEYKTKNITIIDQTNKGLSGARNSGLHLAEGKYVWFIDSDDYIDTEKAIKLYNYLKTCDDDIVLMGRIVEFRETKSYFSPYYAEILNGKEYVEKALNKLKFRTNVWDKVYRRDLLTSIKLKFIEGLNYEDMFFNLVAFFNANKISVFSDNVYIYNCANISSITSSYNIKDLDVLRFVEIAFNYVKSLSHCNFDEVKNGFYILIFNWVSSCLVNKYSSVGINSKERVGILRKTLTHPYFMEAAEYCANTKASVPKRVRLFAKLFMKNPIIYSKCTALALCVKRLSLRIKNAL